MPTTEPITSSGGEPTSTHSRAVLVPAGQLILAATGVYVAVESQSLGLWTSLGPGPGMLPLVLGVALFGLTAVWFVQSLAERRQHVRSADADDAIEAGESEERLDRPYVLGVVGGLLVLAAVMELLGFQISMAVFLFAELTLLGRQKWWIAAVIAVVGSVGVFALFDRVLAVQLPLSSLPFLAGLGL